MGHLRGARRRIRPQRAHRSPHRRRHRPQRRRRHVLDHQMEGRRGLIPARPRHAQPQRAGRGVRHRGHRQTHLRLHDGQRPPARRVQDPRLRGGSGQPGFGRGRPRRVEGVRAGRPMAGRHGTGPRLGSTGQDQRRAVHHLPEDHRARHLPHRPVRPGRLQERHGPVRHQTAALRLGRQRDHHLPCPARTRPRAQARGPQRPRAPPGRRIRLPGHRLRHRPAALRRARRPRRVRPGRPPSPRGSAPHRAPRPPSTAPSPTATGG